MRHKNTACSIFDKGVQVLHIEERVLVPRGPFHFQWLWHVWEHGLQQRQR